MDVKKNLTMTDKKLRGSWQMALSDARRRLHETNLTAQALQKSNEIIGRKIAAGEPSPGESATKI